jgi:hypothetical protein
MATAELSNEKRTCEYFLYDGATLAAAAGLIHRLMYLLTKENGSRRVLFLFLVSFLPSFL